MRDDLPPPPPLAWWLLAPPALAGLLLFADSLLPLPLSPPPERLIALVLDLLASAVLAWNLACLALASLATARVLPGRVRRILAGVVRTLGTEQSRRLLLRAGVTASLGAGLLSACSEPLASIPLGDDLSWGATTAQPVGASTARPTPAPRVTPPDPTPVAVPGTQRAPSPSVSPASPPSTGRATAAASPSATGRAHTVVAGETLWGIAREALGPSATDARVASTWPLIHERNRAVIGDDPDLIHPGTVLTLEGIVP